MKKSSGFRNTIFLVSVAIFIVAVGGYVYLFHESSYFVTKVLDARKILNASEMTRLQGKDIMKLYQDTVEDRPKIDSIFVSAENAVPFIKSVESIEGLSGATVSITSIKATQPDPESEDKIGRVSIAVSVSGEWRDVMKVLELFETLPYRVEINRTNLEVSVDTSSKTPVRMWRMSLDLNAASTIK